MSEHEALFQLQKKDEGPRLAVSRYHGVGKEMMIGRCLCQSQAIGSQCSLMRRNAKSKCGVLSESGEGKENIL